MNKKFLRVSVFSLFVLFATNSVNAQSQDVHNVSIYMTQGMSFLNMTPTQVEQVYQVNLQAANATEKVGNIEGFAKILKERNLSLKEILSPAQFQLFQENKMARAAIFRTVVMTKMLDLSQDQLEPVFNINQKVVENVRKDLDAYFSADNNSGKNKAKRKLHKALKKTDKAFDKVLSPHQITIYHENAEFLRNVISEEYVTKVSF